VADGGLSMNAIGFVALILAFIWFGTWALQIAAIVVVVALRILFVVGLAVFGLVASAVMAVVDPKGFKRAWRESAPRTGIAARDRWA
jgi:phosphoglycerol transferase MdoB-like AlkP superfamily enzyme